MRDETQTLPPYSKQRSANAVNTIVLLFFVGRMMSAIAGNGNSAPPAESPPFRSAMQILRQAAGGSENRIDR